MVAALTIAGRRIGAGERCFVIAEAGVNHNGDLAQAKALIDAAVSAGADAVKFQTFRAEALASEAAPKAAYQRGTTDPRESQRAMLSRLELSEAAHRELIAHSTARGILFLSTPFDQESADLLERLGLPAFKIASGEITNLALLAHVARKGRPMLVSTGMSTLAEVRDAVEAIRGEGARELALLHCVSCYPADPADANLRAMQTLARSFGVPVGFSDHTMGCEVAWLAVALGACLIEKHVTLDRGLPGPDHRASLEPREFRQLVEGIRLTERALGHGRKEPVGAEAAIAAVARKSVVAARAIPAGCAISRDMLAIKRPGTGLAPSLLERIVGSVARETIAAGAVLRAEMLDPEPRLDTGAVMAPTRQAGA